ncbi:MAG: hypothetical protein UE033_10095 [Coprococcus sp.]|nr:hypothetical protein [Coprococcus sp.]
MENMTITTGKVYDAMLQTEKLREQFENAMQDINADRDLSEEGKEKKIALIKADYTKKNNDLKALMIDAVEEIKGTIASTAYEYDANLEHSIDFIKTMSDAGILTDAMFRHEMDKYRGREMDYVFAREKLKGSIPIDRFNDYTFSTYGDYDVNGERSFVSPLEHFNKLEEYIRSDNDIMTAHMMEQTENKLGIKSVGRQNYNAEQKAKLQTMTANTSRLI